METLIVVLGIVLAVIGTGVAIWSIIDTRKKYYEEYLRRKRGVWH